MFEKLFGKKPGKTMEEAISKACDSLDSCYCNKECCNGTRYNEDPPTDVIMGRRFFAELEDGAWFIQWFDTDLMEVRDVNFQTPSREIAIAVMNFLDDQLGPIGSEYPDTPPEQTVE